MFEMLCCDLLARLAAFHFLSREEKHTRAVTTNMKGHFIDGLAKSLDICEVEIALPKVVGMKMAQTPAIRDVRKHGARRCFSAATGACR
ncbi:MULTISPECIES: hypothetical protein [unclassified Bradyrhizobium]